MFLTEEELKELTGYKRPTSMRRWLAERQYRFEVDRTGYPKVLRDSVMSRLNVETKPRLNLR